MTFVGIDGKAFVVEQHDDPYSSEKVPDTLRSCDSVTQGQVAQVICIGGKQLDSCQP
jgi:hypothetical protein